MIYESRPNVTVDAAALCLKSGNAVILRGGTDALRSNAGARGAPSPRGSPQAGLPRPAVQLVPDARPRGHLRAAQARRAHRPLHPPRRRGAHPLRGGARARPGGEALQGRLPRLRARDAPTRTWRSALIVNAKAQRPGVCNAAECLLVDRAAAERAPAAGRGGRWPAQASSCAADPTSLTLLARAGVPVGRGRPGRLRPGVPRPDPGGAGGDGPRRGARSHRRATARAHRGHRHPRLRQRRAASRAR